MQDDRPIGIRDTALIAVMYSGGLRRAEVSTLDLDDYDPGAGQLVVHGKRSKERLVYLAEGAIEAVNDWLKVRGSDPGPLFISIRKGGQLVQNRNIPPGALYNLLHRRAKKTGISSFSPHDLRRTFVSDLLDAGVDIATVAKLAGHSNVQTTLRYDRRPEEAKKEAAKLLHVPYGRNMNDS